MERHWKWLLILIIGVAFILRFYQLTHVPITLNPDEKFNGYLAYSLLKTGKDLDGNFFPLAFKSFGDWSLIGYPLLTIIPVAIFGLNDFSARLIGAASGIVATGLVFLVTQELFGKRKISLLAALFFAISPWSIYFSRISHETGLGLTFFLAGLFFFLRFIKDRISRWPLILAAAFWAASLLTQYAYAIFTPIMAGVLVWIYQPSLRKASNVVAGIIFVTMLAFVFLTIIRGSGHELSDVGLFNNRDILYNRVDRYLADYQAGDVLARIHNHVTGILYQLGQNYIATFSPKFLFDEGGQSQLHNLGFFGWLYQTDFALGVAGLLLLFWWRERFAWILIAWLAIAPLASFFTKDHPSSTRLFPLAGVLVVLSAYGAYGVTKLVNKYSAGVIIATAIAINFLFFLDFYFKHFNVLRARFLYYGYKEATEIAKQYPDKKVVMIGPENFPFINFLFYNRYDPDKFRREVVYYPQGGTVFRFVQSFGNFEFPWTIDRRFSQSGVLYFDRHRAADTRNVITLPDGDGIFTYYTISDLDPRTTDVK